MARGRCRLDTATPRRGRIVDRRGRTATGRGEPIRNVRPGDRRTRGTTPGPWTLRSHDDGHDATHQTPEGDPGLPPGVPRRARVRAELRGDREALRLRVAGHRARAPGESEAEGIHPEGLQRESLDPIGSRRH